MDRTFELTRDGFALLAMGFTGAKALRFAYAKHLSAKFQMGRRTRAQPTKYLILSRFCGCLCGTGSMILASMGTRVGGSLAAGIVRTHEGGMQITAAQTRAARALASVTQRQLAAVTGLALSTIAEFESGARDPLPATRDTIRAALADRGIMFLAAGREGPGVRLRRRRDNQGEPS